MFASYFYNDLRATDHKDSVHTSVFPRPQLQADIHFFKDYTGDRAEQFIPRKLFNESLIQVEKEDYQLYIDPVTNFNIGTDHTGTTWQNTRGYFFRANINEKVQLRSWFKENQAAPAFHIEEYIAHRKVIPGEGLARPFGDGNWDYASAGGTIAWKVSKYFDILAGQDQNFIGQGYRSTFLGRQHLSYPFLRLQTNLWKFRYTNLYMALQEIDPRYRLGGMNGRKYAAMHMLSWQINKKWNVSFFEATISQDSNRTRGLDVHYWNPIIFYRPVDFSLASPDNMLLGAAFSYADNDLTVYGQLLLDELTVSEVIAAEGYWANKWAWQLGAKYELYRENFYGLFRLETNTARPYMYTAASPLQNYSHYGEPLAHPLGANFKEYLAKADIYFQRWQFQLHVALVEQGLDTNGSNWGANIWESYRDREQDYGNNTGQGLKQQYLNSSLKVAYIINPMNNLQVYASLFNRTVFMGEQREKGTWFGFGLSTKLFVLTN